MEILPIIMVDILVLVVFGFIVYKVIQRATKNKILFLENEAKDLVEKAKREAEATKKESILEAKEEVTFIKNEMVLIKMNNYNLENKFNILHSIMYLSNILASKSISDLDMWLDNDEQKVILKLSKDINREDYKNIEISLEQLEKYGIWVSLNVDLYRDIKEKIEIS